MMKLVLNFALRIATKKHQTLTQFRNTRELHNNPLGKNPGVQRRQFHASDGRKGAQWCAEFLSDQQVAQRIESESRTFPYAVHRAEFTTCEAYYQSLLAQGRGRRWPLTGVTFDVAYVDTHPDAPPTKPTVVALHGCPGNHLDFKELTAFLDGKGVRVIAPNFPGYGWTPTDKYKYFTHTQTEKAIFVTDFLDTINVKKVDLMIAHSAGVYPGLQLYSHDARVASMVMINPGSLQRIEGLQPKWIFKLTSRGYRHYFFRVLSLVMIKLLLRIIGYGNTDAHQMSVAFETLVNIDFDMSRQDAAKLASLKSKLGLIYSTNDRVVTLPQFEEYVKVLGNDEDVVSRYDLNGGLTKARTDICSTFQAHRFETGGHFVMKKFPNAVNNIIYEFLKDVRPDLK